MIFRNLWRRQVRTLLTIAGIAVGIASLVALVALSKGIVANYVQATNRTGVDVTLQSVQGEGQALTLGTGFDEDVVIKVRQMPEVKSASGVLYTLVPMPEVPYFIVFGYEPDQRGIRHFRVTTGATLEGTRAARGGKPILLGKTAAKNLNKGTGDTLLLKEVAFRVVGIYETGIAFEDAGGVISLRDAQALANMPHQVIYVGIQLQHPQRAEEFKSKLARMLPKDVEIAGTQAGNMMLEMLGMLDAFAWGVALVAALVGGVGMMNTMLMSIYERTREIGVLRAVGWRPARVLGMILSESLVLSFVGGLLGLAIGAALTWVAAHSPAMEGMTRDSVSMALVAQAMTMAVVLGLTGGLYPAWRASRLHPVEALSYDGGVASRIRARVLPGGLAMRNLMRQRTRTVLTLVGVGTGVLSMFLVGSLAEGASRSFSGMFTGTELTMVEAGLADTSQSAVEERVLGRIAAMPEVQYVTGMLMGVVSTPKEPFFIVTGREPTDPLLNPRVLHEGTLSMGPRQCLLGWKAADLYGKRIGDRMNLFGTPFTVVGIVQTGSAFEDSGAIITLREAQQFLKKPHQVMAAQIKLRDPARADEMLTRLSAEYPKLLLSKSADFVENLPDMQHSRQEVYAIYALTVLVGSIALTNTMVMSVHERTREIGVLRALGWRSRMVLLQILAESLLVTLLSGLVGLLGTMALVQVIRLMPLASIYRELFVVTPNVVVQGFGLCVLLGALGGLYPAWRATRLSPVEALRYE